MTPREFAIAMGYKANYGNQLLKDGRLVLAEDGKTVLFEQSKARLEATKDPSKQGVADRHAATRAADAPDSAYLPTDAAPGQPERSQPQDRPDVGATGSSYQQARAVKEKFFALEAKRAYEVAIGQLRDAREVEGVVASAMVELRLRLETLSAALAPLLAAQTDEIKIRATLSDHFAHALESASHHFAALASKPTAAQ